MSVQRGRAGLVAFGLVVLGFIPRPGAAQSVTTLAQSCVSAGGPQASCTETAVTAAAVQGFTGLLAGLGSEVPGSASTLGRRLGLTPRFSLGIRASLPHVAMPDLRDPSGPPSTKAGFLVPTVEANFAAGVLNGFSLLPTVGGVLSLDVLGDASVLFLPSGQGFAGKAAAYTIGARVGVFRESFTLPGVSVSVSHRSVSAVRLNTSAGGVIPSLSVDPSVTSIRATVGKDLMGVGVLAGMGWDWYGGRAAIRVANDSLNTFRGSVAQLHQHRRLYFVGASVTDLILQFSAELGWAGGFGPVAGYRGNPFDPTAGTFFGSVAMRLTI